METLAFDDEEETRVENEFCDDKGDTLPSFDPSCMAAEG